MTILQFRRPPLACNMACDMARDMRGTTDTPHSFAAKSHAQWRAALEEELGSERFGRLWTTETPEGIQVEALHEDTPGRFGGRSLAAAAPWRAEAIVDAGGDLETVRDRMRQDIDRGVRGLRFCNLRPFDLDYLLDGVDLTLVAVHFDGGDPIEYGQALLRVTHETHTMARKVHGGFGARGHGAAIDFARWVRVEFREMAATRISTVRECEAGCGQALQIGLALAEGAQRLTEWHAGGFEVNLCSRAMEFEFALGTDIFLELAKLRAARLAWAKLIAAAGGDSNAQTMRIAARSSLRSFSKRDPWVNLLRGTTMTFTAATGGADSFCLLPFDACLGVSDAQARRLAANTQAILAREAHLEGLEDPAAGSGLVEDLTNTLAREGWARFQDIQRAGGLAAARAQGQVQRAISEANEAETRAVRTRQRGILGVSEFPNLSESLPRRAANPEPFAAARLAEPFENLRDRSDKHLAAKGQRPQVFLTCIGTHAKTHPREVFARNLFAAGGIETISGAQDKTAAALVDAFAASGAQLFAIVCGSVEDAQAARGLAQEISALGATVLLTGGSQAGADADRKVGIAHFIHEGADALALLEQLLDDAGVEA
ncbi:MAG TPA: hypothetical protein EYG30_12525 [Planctomycetes bacterium]|nr:hypothetical protein [Planctomycetota bacterium]HIL53065.1 hypothetical protein [Planctomycetota bacterium]